MVTSQRSGALMLALALGALASCGPDTADRPVSRKPAFGGIEHTCVSFLEDVAAERFGAAHGRLCAPVQAMLPEDVFERAMQANVYLRSAQGMATVDQTSFGRGVGEMNGVLQTAAGRVLVDFYLVALEPEAALAPARERVGSAPTPTPESAPTPLWCLSGVIIGGTPALPAPGSMTSNSPDRGGSQGSATAPDRR